LNKAIGKYEIDKKMMQTKLSLAEEQIEVLEKDNLINKKNLQRAKNELALA